MTEFNKYLKEARQEFCKEVNKYNVSDNLQLRTACDSFLIAFDQATEKAINYTHCCKSDSELLKDEEIPKIDDWIKDLGYTQITFSYVYKKEGTYKDREQLCKEYKKEFCL
jgi:hypothetical protein